MSSHNAELSSIQSALEEITHRIKVIADTATADPNDASSPHLVALERSLASAIRSIIKAQKAK
ncbi:MULTISPECIES: hypothetical protein [Acidithrix]|uniref:Uncharacterized protein n=1 Tax=Acidithrix ferrooxidans TaxID=1280514 RepID=A0A0D8HEG5_9ACTN|nr:MULTISPECIES: hypothetical protein [Acidithrix]KJF16330.1 hypothetical protein AXFE_28330 [Acidithrix ferrooxidans]CAG4922733.1 unnamed protein product [Acidithrix sp. C25]